MKFSNVLRNCCVRWCKFFNAVKQYLAMKKIFRILGKILYISSFRLFNDLKSKLISPNQATQKSNFL